MHRQGIELRNQANQGADAVVIVGRQHGGVRKGECIYNLAQSKTPGMCGNSMRENREIPCFPCGSRKQGRIGKILGFQANDERTREVGQLRSTCETVKQC